ncbi:WYL domain-containing protein [Polaribacter pectinis]|uniref:WYL domain-containing protein n=1 Tax=Polaribacter pectinis TaxID=2738844 RepID=A0A7G9L7H9_9FLAO|nr:WYL domain-containing protein [Polaribacter pectinis]QNM84578.1 WYL domain-containing protein [Polaribacter pectinis]
MANYFISLKIQLLIQYVHDYNFPSKEQIIDYLADKDLEVSSRTLDRYFARIRADFGIEISYNSLEKGYFIDEEKSVKVSSFFKFLEIIQVADIFSNSLKDSNKILEYVSFDDSTNFIGIENLKDILLAIKQEKEIDFIHENFEKNSKKKYIITPLILKEYLNRWYVVGAINEDNEIRTFGIDRISNIEITNLSTKKRENYTEKLEKFKHTVGLTYWEGDPVNVSLLVDELHVKYMRSLPLHQSQVILPKNKDNKHQVNFYIYPNYEFMTQILKIGAEVEVLSPKHLRDDIVRMLEASLKNYK